MRCKHVVHNIVELFTFCRRFEHLHSSVCEFERSGDLKGEDIFSNLL